MFDNHNDNLSSKQYTGLIPLQLGTDAVLQHLSVNNHTDCQFIIAIAKNWQHIMPSPYTQYCLPIKLQQDNTKNYILHIKITNRTAGIFIEQIKPKIIERLNLIFGYRAIAGIKLIV